MCRVLTVIRIYDIRNGCKGRVKMYKRRYDKYKYYAVVWTGSIKEYIDGKAGGKIYVVMYKYSNRPYVWYRNTMAESIKASMDEKGGGNMYVGQAALGKSIVIDKRYKRKYNKYKYYTVACTGCTKEYIDGKAGGNIYVEVYKHSNRPYVWYRNTLAESTKASIDEKGGGNMYVEPAAVADKRYLRTRGKTAGSIRLRIEAYECRGRCRKHVKDSSVTLFSVSDKMDQDGVGNNPEMVANVPQQAASTGEYYLVEVPRYNLSTCIAMLLSAIVCAYKPYMSNILVIC